MAIDYTKYVTRNLLAQIAVHEGFYARASGDRAGTQIGFGYNRGAETRSQASGVLGTNITSKALIDHNQAISLTAHKIGQKIESFIVPHIGLDKFDKLSPNMQSAVLDTLYNLTDRSAVKFAKKISDYITSDRIAGIPAYIANAYTMPGTDYHTGLSRRRQDAFRLAILPEGQTFVPGNGRITNHTTGETIALNDIFTGPAITNGIALASAGPTAKSQPRMIT